MIWLGDDLHAKHALLEDLFEEVLNRVHTSDPSTIDEGWVRFERALESHMRYEEERLLPLFSLADPAAAQAIRDDHARIRALLAEMGVAVQLHTLREDSVEEFLGALRDHAKREEATLYRWANRVSPKPQTPAQTPGA